MEVSFQIGKQVEVAWDQGLGIRVDATIPHTRLCNQCLVSRCIDVKQQDCDWDTCTVNHKSKKPIIYRLLCT